MIEHAVKGMLPKTTLGRKQGMKLKVYAGPEHPHAAQNPIKIGKNTLYIAKANNMLNDHMVILIVGVVLTALLPLYAKLLRKINTSVSVEDNGKLDAIDISGEA